MVVRLSVVVIGSGRSGTGWAARHLTANGQSCGHESVFDWTPYSTPTRRLDYPGRTPSPHEAPGELVAESSLAAIAYLGQLDASVRVWHLARDPAACVASWAHFEILDDDATPYGAFCRRHVPAIAEEANGLGRAARWVAEWNLRGWREAHDRPGYRLDRLEDVAEGEPVNARPHPPAELDEVLASCSLGTARLLLSWAELAGYPAEQVV